ncbi:MAG: glucokinase, partial [Gammaproteobacteria bacterium]|nr:glucokinase [Gammaproteobacteria bacterium]
MNKEQLLIGDIGGTNARFALIKTGSNRYSDEEILQCKDFAGPIEAIQEYLRRSGNSKPEAICLAVAGPVRNGNVCLTNNHWQVQTSELIDFFKIEHVKLLNDFEAIAYSLPVLSGEEFKVIGEIVTPSFTNSNLTVGVVGPGTGLGAAALLKRDGRLHALVTEAGHVGFAPENSMQLEMLKILQKEFGHVSDEQLLSGPGLENIYKALAKIKDIFAEPLSAAEIFESGNSNQVAVSSIEMFLQILGQVVGNFVLSPGAFAVVYIG